MYYWGIDITYIVLVLPAIIFTFIAQSKVTSTFNKYSKIVTKRGYTGEQIARSMLSANGLNHIRVEYCQGTLSDHFDPKNNVIRLSQGVYNSTSVAAAGVAAHECGHAIQHAQEYGPIKLRTAIIPITRFGSSLAMPLIILGFILGFQALVSVGIIFFGAAVVFQLVTLPVEFNASSRAINTLESNGVLTTDEIPMAKKVLSAAAMTYVAALAVSLAQFLRLLFLFGGRRRD